MRKRWKTAEILILRYQVAVLQRRQPCRLKKNGVVFRDPAEPPQGRPDRYAIFQPLLPGQIDQAVEAATTPHARVFVALAACGRPRGPRRSAPSSSATPTWATAGCHRRADPAAGRPHLPGAARLAHYRQARWPNTANPHLLISRRTAPGTGPVSHAWLRSLRGLPATLDRLRIDRQLEEALTCGADPLHLAVVFGLKDTTAVRYAASARQLLARPHETGPCVPAAPLIPGPPGAVPACRSTVSAGQGTASGPGTGPA